MASSGELGRNTEPPYESGEGGRGQASGEALLQVKEGRRIGMGEGEVDRKLRWVGGIFLSTALIHLSLKEC